MMRGDRLLLVAMALAMAVAPLAAASNPDFSDSFRHWKADAERGQAGAQNLMGQAYWRGRGTYPDYARAYFWFSLAAAQGDDRLEKQMTPAELHQARRLIGEWRARSR
jgi:TPR repeat protein